VFLVYESASRSSGLALLVLLSALFLRYMAMRWGRIGGLAAFALAGVSLLAYLISYQPLPDRGIFRTNNSREDVWADLIGDFKSSPLFGVGWKNVSSSYEGFFHLMAAQAGLVGLALAIAAVFVLGRSMLQFGTRGAAVFAALLIAITFEGWLLVGGSGYAWAVWLLASSCRPTKHSKAALPPSQPGPRPSRKQTRLPS
jgi:hypothetical protein